jgi:uncharacterized phiE125 gp8 family phage protein
MTATRLITPPTALAVSMVEARIAARVDLDDDGTSPLDGEITRAIRTYTTEAEGETCRAIMAQTWVLTLDAFPPSIQLRYPPLMQVDHIKFYDVDGVQQTLHPEDFEVDAESEPAWIVPAPGRAWPETAKRIKAVEVQFQCGYGADPALVPDAISGFILARVSEQFKTGAHAVNEYVTRLLWPQKVYL